MDKRQKLANNGKRVSFELPLPVVEVLRQGQAYCASSYLVNQFWPLIVKLSEWSFFYFLALLGFSYGWVLVLASAYYIQANEHEQASVETLVSRLSASKKSEKEILSENLLSFPAWVSFPDFSRVEWINDLLRRLWPDLTQFVNDFVKDFIEPEINLILERMSLDTVSKFQLKKIVLGNTPASLGGIKVYSKNSATDEIILDCDVAYSGEARVVFTLQGLTAEINDINFRGLARITLKPILGRFPFFGGFEIYFLKMPTLDYHLGGFAATGDSPVIKSLVKSIVEGEIKSRFVWPNRFRVFFPIEDVQNMQSRVYMLPKPSGYLDIEIIRGRKLVAKDGHFMGSGKSDPYVIVNVGDKKVSFRDRFVPKTINPEWNYTVNDILIEDYFGQNIHFEVYDHDRTNGDDFMGRVQIPLETVCVENTTQEGWITLENVERGEILVKTIWHPVVNIDETDFCIDANVSKFVLSVFVDRCVSLSTGSRSSITPKCKLSVGQSTPKMTSPKPKTTEPVFQEGFTFLSKNPYQDKLTVQVLDHRAGDYLLCQVSISINFLLQSPRNEFSNMVWNLEGSQNHNSTIYLSAKLFPVN